MLRIVFLFNLKTSSFQFIFHVVMLILWLVLWVRWVDSVFSLFKNIGFIFQLHPSILRTSLIIIIIIFYWVISFSWLGSLIWHVYLYLLDSFFQIFFYLFFYFFSSTFGLLKLNFLICFDFLSMNLSQSNDLNHGFLG
jgi:hypothetical protein